MEAKCIVNVMHSDYHETTTLVPGKAVFHETSPWCPQNRLVCCSWKGGLTGDWSGKAGVASAPVIIYNKALASLP